LDLGLLRAFSMACCSISPFSFLHGAAKISRLTMPPSRFIHLDSISSFSRVGGFHVERAATAGGLRRRTRTLTIRCGMLSRGSLPIACHGLGARVLQPAW